VSAPIRIHLDDRREETVIVPIHSSTESVVVPLPARPIQVELDPDFMVFRRIARDALPPVLNHYVTDPRRTIVLAFSDRSSTPSPLRDVVARIEAQEREKPAGERTTIVLSTSEKLLPREGSVLLLGGPEQQGSIQTMIAPHCGTRVTLTDAGFVIDGTSYEGPGMAVLLSCHRLDEPGSVVTLLYAVSPQAVARVARLLFFYGWNSVVVFKDGSVLSRFEWHSERAVKEVRLGVS
jgi:aminopeptidase N